MKGYQPKTGSLYSALFSFSCLNLLLTTITTAQVMTPNEILYGKYDGGDPFADLDAFPTVPEGFEITLVAKEPLVRNPCAIAFDGRGRMFIGQGPQYRRMTPETPKDSVYILLDDDGDGVADRRHLFATGFNGIQGLVWNGGDLYIANAPDLTVVRDLDGDDVADEYVKLYTDLGNIEHALHGLNIAPDGRLYMSKGNSKGLSLPGRVAPKPFRELFGLDAPEGSPDFPEPQLYTAETYEATFQDPNDDWGRMGGILRAQPDGSELEIVSHGARNPWDINFSDTFDWLGGDNDQLEGDRFFRSFNGAHLGWNHAWSSSWTGEGHLPTAPALLPLVDGSTTGVVYYDAKAFPEPYRGFLVGDWLRKVVYLIKTEWDGAEMKMAGGEPVDFVKGGSSLFRTTDLEIGADGALYALSWGTTYGAEFENGEMTNAGRVWRIAWVGSDKTWSRSLRPISDLSTSELLTALDHNLKARRVDAAAELIERNEADALKEWLGKTDLSAVQQTWGMWTLGRMNPEDRSLDPSFLEKLDDRGESSFNRRLQAIRILGFRASQSGRSLPDGFSRALQNREPRIRQAAAIAAMEADDQAVVDQLIQLLAEETDRIVFYSTWQALRRLLDTSNLIVLLDHRAGQVRLGALLGLLETRSIDADAVSSLLEDSDPRVVEKAKSYLVKAGVMDPEPSDDAREEFTGLPYGAFVKNIRAASPRTPRVSPLPLQYGSQLYADASIVLTDIGDAYRGLTYIQNFMEDAYSKGEHFMSFTVPTESTLYVTHDEDIRGNRPSWLIDNFEPFRGNRFRGTAKSYGQFKKDVSAGVVNLGGNTLDGKARAAIPYVVMLEAKPLDPPETPTTIESVMEVLDQGDPARGEWLFMGRKGPVCWTCHQVDGLGLNYGPDLSLIGERDDIRHWVESLLEPNAIVTEGFATQSVTTSDGGAYAGVLAEESDLALTLQQVTGDLMRIQKSKITSRTSLHTSLMPSVATTLGARDVADLVSYLSNLRSDAKRQEGFGFEWASNELTILHDGEPITANVMKDPDIPRPYFYNLNTLDGVRVTRNFPPIEGVDATDHAEYHPGLWMAYGDINGNDYWRLKHAVKHQRFLSPPKVENGRLTFSVENTFHDSEDQAIGKQKSFFTFEEMDGGYLIHWEDEYAPTGEAIVFGDQEEMGLGIRMATPLTELATGIIRTSAGLETAKQAWGKEAAWSDYSGIADGRHAGITIMGDPNNFRPTWWHSRNYGAMVTNVFGRQAMRQGEKSAVPVKHGEALKLRFGVYVHSGDMQMSTDAIEKVFDAFAKQ